MNTVEIRSRASEIKKELENLIATAENEIREMTKEEEEKENELKEELTDLAKELDEKEKELNASDEEEEANEEEKEVNKIEEKNIRTMSKTFRLLSAIADVANNRNLSDEAKAVVAEGAEEMRNAGLSFGGQIQLPVGEMRAAITVATEHDDVVSVDVADVLEPLRAKNVLVLAGAKLMTGLVGDVVVPAMSASNVAWEGETAEASDGAGSFSSVKLQPKRLTAYVDVSKQFILQTSDSAERVIREDLINAINTKLESTILGNLSGTTSRPEGIFYNNGSALTVNDSYAELIDFEADVEDANVLGEKKYIMSNKARAIYRTTAKGSTTGGMICEYNEIDGTPVLYSSNVVGKGVAYGDFSNLAIGQWGAIDLTIDPYTVAKEGKVRLVVNAYFDAKVLRDGAIAVCAAGA